jgi:hypothetical protein
MNFNQLTILLLSLFLISACSAVKKVNKEETQERNISTPYLLQQLEEKAIDYEWFEGRSKLRYIDMTQNRSVKSVIRMRKDSLIWMSFQMFGIEGARVKMTPDSVYVLNRINKQYAIQPLSLVEDMINIPADFKALQALLIGNPVLYPEATYNLETKDSFYLLSTDTILNTTYNIQKESYQINSLTLKNESKQKVEMSFENYQTLENDRIFSMMRDILISSPTKGNASVEIEYNKTIFDIPKSTGFNIPSSYKKVDSF